MVKTGGGSSKKPEDAEELVELESLDGLEMDLEGSDAPPDGVKEPLSGPTAAETVTELISNAERATEPPALPKNRGGRPRKDGMPPGLGEIRLNVPTPRFSVFTSDNTNMNARSKAGWTWLGELPTWCKDKLTLYVYRMHPVLLEPPDDDDGRPKYFKYIDKITGNDTLRDDMELLARYGCGSYKIVVNEMGNSKSQQLDSRTIMTIFCNNVGGADYKSNPPTDMRISDVSQVDLDNPANKSFVSYLRGRGLLPEQQDGKLKEAEMANVQAVQELSASVERMANKAIDAATKRSESPEANATAKAVEVVADASRRSNELLQNATATVMETLRAVNEGKSAGMGMAEVIQLVEMLLPRIQAGGAGGDELAAIRLELQRLKDAQIEELRRENERLKTNPQTTAPGSPFAYFRDGVAALKEMKSTMDELGGGATTASAVEEIAEAAAPGWTKLISPIASLIDKGLQAFIAYQMNQARANMPPGMQMPMPAPAPVQYQPQNPQPVPPPGIAAPVVQMQPAPASAGAGTSAGAPASTTPGGINVELLVAGIATPLLNHLTAEPDEDGKFLTGSDFADWFIGGYGIDVFKEVALYGDQMLLAALFSYPPLAEKLREIPEPRLTGFVQEFVSFDPEKEEAEDAAADTSKTLPPSPSAA